MSARRGSGASYGGRSRSGRGGCLGCLGTALALVVALALLAQRVGVPVLDVSRALARRAVDAVESTVTADDADGETPPDGQAGDLSADGTELGYAGARLPDGQQDVYLQMLAGIRKLDESIVVLGASAPDIDPAYRAVMRDHPELFWLDGSCSYTYTPIGGIVTVEPGLLFPTDQVEGLQTQIEAVASGFEQTLPADASDYDVAKAAYEFVIGTTDYALDAAYNQSMLSVFLNHSSVCAGYARAFEYLLHRAGIPCAYVEGSILDDGEDHAWNLACLDGVYTYVDTTWGDPTYLGDADGLVPSDTGIIYDYLCLTTDELSRDRHVFADPSAWPACDDASLDYYARRGLLFDAYDEGLLKGAFWSQEQTGERTAAFKFANDKAYAAARDALAAGEFLHDDLVNLAGDLGVDGLRYGYTTSDALRILKLYW